MPCYTERTVSADLKVADRAILERALEAEGLNPQMADTLIATGKVSVTGSYVTQADAEKLATRINTSYSREVVRTFAKKHGWNQKVDAKGKITLTRRTF